MPRRGRRGEGSVYHRNDGRWEVRFTADGRPIRRVLSKSTTRDEAERALREAVRQTRAGLLTGSSRQLVGDYLARWVADVLPQHVGARTLERYAGVVRSHLLPAIGHLRLEQLSPQHVDQLHARCLARMSPASVRMVHAVLSAALRDAVSRRILDSNVAKLVAPPRATSREFRIFDATQLRRFLDLVADNELAVLWIVAATTGLRLGELLALRWDDVDLERKQVAVRYSVRWRGPRWVLDTPKTARSRRTVALSQRAVSALRQHRVRQLRDQLAAGPAWGNHGFVVCDVWGEPIRGPHVTERRFKPMLETLGFPSIRFHDLRHSFATLALGRGENPKVVSEMLGHSSVDVTLRVYSHVLPGMQEALVARMDAELA